MSIISHRAPGGRSAWSASPVAADHAVAAIFFICNCCRRMQSSQAACCSTGRTCLQLSDRKDAKLRGRSAGGFRIR